MCSPAPSLQRLGKLHWCPHFHIVYHRSQEIVSWIQNPDVDADLYAMFSAVAAPTAYFAAQL